MQAVTVGEVLIELERGRDGRFEQRFGGDTFLAAIHLARSGIATGFSTALGQDPHSDAAVGAAAVEGIATDLILRIADRLPGLSLIEPGEGGELRCEFWRDTSPARQLFELPGWDRIAEQLVGTELVYLTSTTLSLYSNVGLGRLLAALEFARERGAVVAFGGAVNLRTWRGDEQRARAVLAEALKRTSIALPSFAADAKLWGDPSPAASIERLSTFGLREIVVKHGTGSALVRLDNETLEVPAPEKAGSGDGAEAAFDAGFLAARLRKETPEAAALAGHRLAAEAHKTPVSPRRNGRSN